MAEERLQSQIQQAYGQGIQGTDISDITEYYGGEVKRKREEYKSALDIGSDLTEKYYNKIGDDLNSIIESASRGELEVGSPQWNKQVQMFKNKALQSKQLQDQYKEREDLLLENPDKTAFYEEIDGEMVDTGYEGFLRNWNQMLDKDYENFGEMVNEHATMLQKATVLPQGVTEGYKDLRFAAKGLQEELFDGKLPVMKREVSVGSGNVIVSATTTLSEEDTQRAVDSLYDQFSETIAADYYKRKGNGQNLGMTVEEYVGQTISDMLPKQRVETSSERFTTYKSGKGVSKKDIETARNVKEDVAKLQKTKDPKYILDYVSGNDFRAEIDGDYLMLYELGRSAGQEDRLTKEISLSGDAQAIYDAISDINPNISREAIDQQPDPNIPDNKAWAQEVDNKLKSISDTGNTEDVSRWLLNIDGVTNIGASFGYIRTVTVDGEKYDLKDEDDQAELNTVLKGKAKSTRGILDPPK
jgi:hypothetical protein